MLHQANSVDESKLLQQCTVHPIEKVCLLLGLNRSSIYRHKQVKPKQISQREQHVINRTCDIFKMSGQNYGSRRILRNLRAENIAIGRYKVRRIMRQHDLKTTWTRAFKRTTDSKHTMQVADNVLDQHFKPHNANEA